MLNPLVRALALLATLLAVIGCKSTPTVVPLYRAPFFEGDTCFTAIRDSTMVFHVVAGDPDGDIVRFSSGNLPAGALLDERGGLTWMASDSAGVTFRFAVTATDPGGLSTTRSYQLRVLDAPMHAVSSWGSYGTGPGQFTGEVSLAVDRDGFVYAYESRQNRLQKFRTDGTYVREWRLNGGVEGPAKGMAVDAAGRLSVAVSGNTIMRYTSTGDFLGSVTMPRLPTGQAFQTTGIRADNAGNLYIRGIYQRLNGPDCCTFLDTLTRVTPTGEPDSAWQASTLGRNRQGYEYIASVPDGRVFTRKDFEKRYLAVFDTTGEERESFSPVGCPPFEYLIIDYLTTDVRGRVYIAASGSLLVYDDHGQLREMWEQLPSMRNPAWVAIAPNGQHAYFANYANNDHRIEHWSYGAAASPNTPAPARRAPTLTRLAPH